MLEIILTDKYTLPLEFKTVVACVCVYLYYICPQIASSLIVFLSPYHTHINHNIHNYILQNWLLGHKLLRYVKYLTGSQILHIP